MRQLLIISLLIVAIEGRPYSTVCFEKAHLSHPHHHRLICGHDILTDQIEKCGRNCAPSKKDQKPSGVGFECPVPACRNQSKVFRPKRGDARPRRCVLSHVYGLDAVADQKRAAEKSDARTLRTTKVPRSMLASRKQSQSPPPQSEATSTTNTNRPRFTTPRFSVPVDSGEVLNREFANDATRETIMRFSGPGVRHKVNGRFMTDKEKASQAQATIMTRAMGSTQVATKDEQRYRAKKAAKIDEEYPPPPDENAEAFQEAEIELPSGPPIMECDHCDKDIDGDRYHCFDCEDYDLCVACFNGKVYKHPAHHRFNVIKMPRTLRNEGAVKFLARFCVCGATSTLYLVLCVDCNTSFHPGCIGAGAYEESDYDVEHLSRDSCLNADYMSWKGGKVFRCEPCQKTFEETAKAQASTRDHRIIERAKKREENAAKGVRSSSPLARPKKRTAGDLEDNAGSDLAQGQNNVAALVGENKDIIAELFGEDQANADSGSGEAEASPAPKRTKFELVMRFKQ